MYKILITFLSVLFLTGCAAKSPTQQIIDTGVAQIERAQKIIKNTETLAQCKETANDSLLSAKETLTNAGESCKSEVSNIESDLIRWKSYFWLLVFGVGAVIYVLIIKKIFKKTI
jgi:hypothetical protein